MHNSFAHDKTPYLTRYALRKLYSRFLSTRMGYDRGDSSPFDFIINFCKHYKYNILDLLVIDIV